MRKDKSQVTHCLDTCSARLQGNYSHPNTTIHHPTLPIIFASGVEKSIRMYSTTSCFANQDIDGKAALPLCDDLSLTDYLKQRSVKDSCGNKGER